jgi:hypothetical protein
MYSRVPILLNHDSTKVIGYAEMNGNKMVCHLTQPMTREQAYNTFGNIGMVILEQSFPMGGGEGLVTAIEIMEWSVGNEPTDN